MSWDLLSVVNNREGMFFIVMVSEVGQSLSDKTGD